MFLREYIILKHRFVVKRFCESYFTFARENHGIRRTICSGTKILRGKKAGAMCGRYQAWVDDEELLGIIEREKIGNAAKYFRQNEVFPGTEIPIIYGSYSTVRAHVAKWGFPAQNGRDIINARAESAASKPMFRDCFQNGRALVLSSGYYEWKDGERHYFGAGNGGAVLMCALEGLFGGVRRYVILTREARGEAARIHDRMPLIIPKEDMRPWLYDIRRAKEILETG